jgi:8-oxo-dGTP diphosphatase
MNNEKPIICADAIALHYEDTRHTQYLIIERLGSVPGLALPGGKQEPDECLSDTIMREFREETGMGFRIDGVIGTFGNPGRDPRGNFISTVFVGYAYDKPRDEPGKTRVLFLTKQEIFSRREEFVLDHFKILEQFFALCVF